MDVTVVPGGLAPAAEGLLRFRHPHVVPVEAAVPTDAGLELHSPPVPGVGLHGLLAALGGLTPGEAVTLGVPLAQALGAAADAGLAHGALTPADVAVDPEGRPVLRGLGVAALAGRVAAPADDVHALALLLTRALGDADGPRADGVRSALAPALAGHPAARPRAAALAVALGRACPPEPLRGLPPPVPPVPSRSASAPAARRRSAAAHRATRPRPVGPAAAASRALRILRGRRPPRRLGAPLWPPPPGVAAGAAGAAALLAALVFVPMARGSAPPAAGEAPPAAPAAPARSSPAPPPPPRAPSPPAATDWCAVVGDLAAARARAFTTGDASALSAADAPGSSAAAVDAARLRRYADAGLRVRGASTAVLGVQVVSSGPAVAELTATERLSAYDLVDRAGRVVDHRAMAPAATYRLTLVRTGAGWRTASAADAGGPAP